MKHIVICAHCEELFEMKTLPRIIGELCGECNNYLSTNKKEVGGNRVMCMSKKTNG